jgi:Na+/proline symporter
VFANPLLAGIVFAGLFAAIMSTSDAFLNIGTAAIIHDMPKAVRGHSVKNELFWARVVTVLLATVAAGFALYSHFADATLVALLGAFGWGTFAAFDLSGGGCRVKLARRVRCWRCHSD